MNKRTKKRMTVLRERLHKLQKMLAGVKQQTDSQEEINELDEQIRKTKAELETYSQQ